MSNGYQALQVPPRAQERGGLEVLRAGVVEGELHVTLRRAFDDPRAWGNLLADVARQVASVYSQQDKKTPEELLALISQSFNTEIDRQENNVSIGPIG